VAAVMPPVADAKTAAAMRPFSFWAADYTARTGRPGQSLFSALLHHSHWLFRIFN